MTTALPPPGPDLLSAALDHAGRGFHIFPLQPGSKVPAIKHWEDDATRDLDRIQRWWRRWPADNIAVACGPSGLHVLDLDTSHGQPSPPSWDRARDGRDVLAQLAAEVGQPIPVPTYAVSTPSVINRWFGHCNNFIDEVLVLDSISLLQCYQQGGNDDHVTGFVRRLEGVVVRVQS
ncbi:bifunctional DNA primase/polymerase [Nocardia sp. NBC_01009]|uniref:bifunctional DNA primase/polymerase n=1 Tax=Nocardia sp. NBC_01009 TaxID=2975996 RepID=UPI003870B941|nr:bifunctional DNA primase/polymerase [Nocardia sp. NBC_01009]